MQHSRLCVKLTTRNHRLKCDYAQLEGDQHGNRDQGTQACTGQETEALSDNANYMCKRVGAGRIEREMFKYSRALAYTVWKRVKVWLDALKLT